MFAITIPYIDPVLTDLGPIAIRWYSLAYIFGIFLGAMHFKYLAKKTDFDVSRDFIDDLITASIISIVLGGRLGFVLIYDSAYYFAHPIEIFKTWNGGMSFHGGFIGFCIAAIMVCKIHKIPILSLFDLAACCAPIGIFLGRIANFINNELGGRLTDVSWAVITPIGDHLPRHASQIYEALTEGLLLFIILNILLFKYNMYKRHGMLSGLFCVLYSVFRFLTEIYRQPDEQLGFVLYDMTMGQVLSLVMFMFGCVLMYFAMLSKKR